MKTKSNDKQASGKIKSLLATLSIALGLVTTASAQKFPEDLKLAYESQGDALFKTLYYLPETRGTVVKHIPDTTEWVGFEFNEWKKIPEETKMLLLDELIAQLQKLDKAAQFAAVKRIREWPEIEAQIGVMGAPGGIEQFLNIACQEPLLQPAFQSAIDSRSVVPTFDPRHIGESLSTGEITTIVPALVGILIELPASGRLECYSRLYARMAQAIEAGEE